MARIGYARVSTSDQDLDTHARKLKAEGCEFIPGHEKVPRAAYSWTVDPRLATILAFPATRATTWLTRLDRLGARHT